MKINEYRCLHFVVVECFRKLASCLTLYVYRSPQATLAPIAALIKITDNPIISLQGISGNYPSRLHIYLK